MTIFKSTASNDKTSGTVTVLNSQAFSTVELVNMIRGTTAPAAPTFDIVAGDNVIDSLERDAGVIVSGATEIGSTVSVVVNGNEAVEASVSGDVWAYFLPTEVIQEGTLTIEATATDEAGNVSDAAIIDVTVSLADVIAPEPPTIDTVASDNVIDDSERADGVTISGTGEANSTATLVFSTENGEQFSSVQFQVAEDGSWAYTLQSDNYSPYYPYGTEIVSAYLTDTAGNSSYQNQTSFELRDTTADAPVIDAISDDNVIDDVEREDGVTISGTGEANSTATLVFSADNGEQFSSVQFQVAEDGSWAYTLANNDYLPYRYGYGYGTEIVSAYLMDAAGNYSNQNQTSFELQDTKLPNIPTIDVVAIDDIIDDVEAANSVWVTGTTEIDSTVSVIVNGGETNWAAVAQDGAWSYELPADVIVDGTLTIEATATDVAGNVGYTATKEVTIVLDNTPPDAPVIDVVSNDDVVNMAEAQNEVTITGTTEIGSIVSVRLNGGEAGEATVNDDIWEYTLPGDVIVDGTLTIEVSASDAKGNVSESSVRDFFVDITAPDAPQFDTVANDNVIDLSERDAGVILSGGAEPYSPLKLWTSAGDIHEIIANSDGTWTYDLAPEDYVDSDVLDIFATATDTAGNLSNENSISVEIDNVHYDLSVDNTIVDEGASTTFYLSTSNVPEGTEIPFNVSGSITRADIDGDLPTSFTVGADGTATVLVNFKKDQLIEGKTPENLTLTLENDLSKTATVSVKDTTLPQKQHTGTVKIDGVAKQGGNLFANTSALKDVNGLGEFKYQWLNNEGTAIKGATHETYTLTKSDVGKTIKVKVSYVDGLGKTEDSTSVATKPVGGLPTYTLTANKTSVYEGSDDSATAIFTLQTTGVAAGTKVPFKFSGKISDADVNGKLPTAVFTVDKNGMASIPVSFKADNVKEGMEKLTITLTNDASKTVSVSVNDKITPKQVPPTGIVSIDAILLQPGEILSANSSTLADANTPMGDFSYTWFNNGTEIADATGETYTLTNDDAGKTITVEVSYTDGLGKVEHVMSAATEIPLPPVPDEGATNYDDKLQGTENDDVIAGMAGNDKLQGLAGNDSLSGDAGNDSLDGGNGDDTLLGGDGKDVLIGGSGNDNIDGGAGNDSLDGGNGNDTLTGGKGTDTMAGGEGDDVYSVANIEDKIIEGNSVKSGNDTILTTLPKLDLKTFQNVENMFYSGLSDFQGTGNDGNNKISGDQGEDNLVGGSGMDTLVGGIGDDTLDGGFGKDSLVGGVGSDTYILNNDGDVILEKAGDAGKDMILTSETFDLSKNPTIEYLKLSGNEAIDGTGNNLNNALEGNDSDNELAGGLGNDSLFGYAGNDTLSGGEGDDVLEGGDGVDKVEFDGNQSDYDIEVDPDGETIQVHYISSDKSVKDGMDTLKNIEKVSFSDSSFNVAIGTVAADKLASTTDVDKFVGLSGKDTFAFTEKDTSVFDNSTFYDEIRDFNHSDGDKIDFSKFDGNEKLASRQALKFVTTDDFSGAAQMRFDKSNGYLLINTDADTTAECVIHLNGVNSLSGADLIL